MSFIFLQLIGWLGKIDLDVFDPKLLRFMCFMVLIVETNFFPIDVSYLLNSRRSISSVNGNNRSNAQAIFKFVCTMNL